nr:hypothetical protein [Oscillochloris trichoides]
MNDYFWETCKRLDDFDQAEAKVDEQIFDLERLRQGIRDDRAHFLASLAHIHDDDVMYGLTKEEDNDA